MLIAQTVEEFRRARRDVVGRVAFVPTMGALHAGHIAHVQAAKRVADTVFVSIFVNPTQFGPTEDLARYPRPFEQDVALCEAAGVACVFAPPADVMYPPGGPAASVDVPELTTILEGAHRPGHFAGVCRVVAKLLHLAEADVVTFGRKDYQQLRVIEAMMRDLMWPTRILEVPTLREPDGLAMSSRNRYLGQQQRPRALGLITALRRAEAMIEREGVTDPARVEAAMAETIAAHGLTLDYAVVRHPQTLRPLDRLAPPTPGSPDATGPADASGSPGSAVALIAARLEGVRLIDNLVVGGA